MRTNLVILVSILFSQPLDAPGQLLSINWFTVDGGGGASSAEEYTVRGTIGQPDAGAMSGGGFYLAGGFWSEAVATDSSPPVLHIHLAGNNIVISWPNPSTGFNFRRPEIFRVCGAT